MFFQVSDFNSIPYFQPVGLCTLSLNGVKQGACFWDHEYSLFILLNIGEQSHYRFITILLLNECVRRIYYRIVKVIISAKVIRV